MIEKSQKTEANSIEKSSGMTEAEIMKALECCIKSNHFGECFENGCPLVSEEGCKVGEETLYPHLFDLLNRKNAECKECGIRTSESIEKLQKQIAEKTADIERLEKAILVQEFMLENQDYKIKKAMGGAIKEFAERVKEAGAKSVEVAFYGNGTETIEFITLRTNLVDQIAKEMGVEL